MSACLYSGSLTVTCTPRWKTSRPVLPCRAEGKRRPASRIGESLEGNDTVISFPSSYAA